MVVADFKAKKLVSNGKVAKKDQDLVIAGKVFTSRMILGITGFAKSSVKDILAAAQSNAITHTISHASDLTDQDETFKNVLPEDILYLPNTHGCKTAEDALYVARKCKKAGLSDWTKLEVSPSEQHYMCDGPETIKAAELLIKDGFTVLPYIHADPVLAKTLEEIGCATVMPLGAPIGTGKGLVARDFIQMIVNEANVPVIVDAGIGRVAHAAEAMEMGVDAVIVHTAILYSDDPVSQAEAFCLAVKAGRQSYLSKARYPAR